MPEYRRAFRPGGTWFFTIVTQNRAPLFADAGARTLLRRAIRSEQARRPFQLQAIVLLPDHLHLILALGSDDADFSTRLGAIKADFTRAYLCGGGDEQPISSGRRREEYRGVWQRRFWEHLIRDEADLHAHLDYVHYNPVKHGLATCPHAWAHSTFAQHVRLGNYDADWLCCCNGRRPTPPTFHLSRCGME